MSLIMIMNMNMNMNMNISIGRRIAASACRRSLTSLYTIHVHLQMEQIFQSIYAPVIIVLSQCRCLRVYHLRLTTAPGRQLTGEERQDQGGYLAFLASNYSDGKEIIYVYGVTVCWPTSKCQNVNVHIAYYIWYIRK
jgi:hypothetical protein